MPNALEASDDLQAIALWLSRYERSATERSYRKEVERFVLWCTTVQGKAVSSASSLDCQAYRAFLANVPQQPVPVGRTDVTINHVTGYAGNPGGQSAKDR